MAKSGTWEEVVVRGKEAPLPFKGVSGAGIGGKAYFFGGYGELGAAEDRGRRAVRALRQLRGDLWDVDLRLRRHGARHGRGPARCFFPRE